MPEMTRSRLLAGEVALYLSDHAPLAAALPWTLSRLHTHLLNEAVVASISDAALASNELSQILPSAFAVVMLGEPLPSKVSLLVYVDRQVLLGWANHQADLQKRLRLSQTPSPTARIPFMRLAAPSSRTALALQARDMSPTSYQRAASSSSSTPPSSSVSSSPLLDEGSGATLSSSLEFSAYAPFKIDCFSCEKLDCGTSTLRREGDLGLHGHNAYDEELFSDLMTELDQPATTIAAQYEDMSRLLEYQTPAEARARGEAVFSTPAVPFLDFCPSHNRDKCLAMGKSECLHRVHLERVLTSSTDISLGDCSYLDTCFKGRACKYVHYRLLPPNKKGALIPRQSFATSLRPPEGRRGSRRTQAVETTGESVPTLPAQYIRCNLRTVDFSQMGGDFAALVVDPPWDIHTNANTHSTSAPTPTYGGRDVMSDAEIAGLKLGQLQTNGVIFLWVTGRALDAGRQCLTAWGYEHIEELLWCKTNQLGRTICTGRTGHWLNHTKEHVLVGVKGALTGLTRQLDVDVLVSTTRGRSKKPEEIYGMLERMVGPHARKLELFGRQNNLRPGWLTMGAELDGTRLLDSELKQRWLLAQSRVSTC